jgi:hypothetical protein
VLAKLLALDEAVAALNARAGVIEHEIENRRERRYANLQRADDECWFEQRLSNHPRI